MEIEIRFFATLKPYTPDGARLIVKQETSPRQIIEELGAPLEEVKLIFINGVRSELDSVLRDKDRLGIFPPVGGG